MRLQVNGAERQVVQGLNVNMLLEYLGLDRRMLALEVNGQLIRREDYDSHSLQEGDRVEVVSFVGGG